MAAQQTRIENTSSGLLSYEDNLTAAESKIRDVDMARETTIFAKYQILVNASNAMLAQANQMPSTVLQLLG
jgi:flagellin